MMRSTGKSSRNVWLPTFLSLAGILSVCNGCAIHRGEHEAQRSRDEVPCATGGVPQIQRRFFVSSQGRMGVNGDPGSFARELTAALNATPHCSAVMLPLDFPVNALPEPGASISPQLARWIEMAGPSPAIDELLIVAVTDIVPFRPMRISGILERRSLVDGTILSRDQRTWNAPLDMDPISPNPINRMILNRPPPMGIVEKHELNRLSPQTFQHTVAEQVAAELAASPL